MKTKISKILIVSIICNSILLIICLIMTNFMKYENKKKDKAIGTKEKIEKCINETKKNEIEENNSSEKKFKDQLEELEPHNINTEEKKEIEEVINKFINGYYSSEKEEKKQIFEKYCSKEFYKLMNENNDYINETLNYTKKNILWELVWMVDKDISKKYVNRIPVIIIYKDTKGEQITECTECSVKYDNNKWIVNDFIAVRSDMSYKFKEGE